MTNASSQQVFVSQPGKSMVAAYVLWFLLGWLGVHRLYLERIGSGVTQLVLFVIGVATALAFVGVVILLALGVWLLVDLVLIPGIVIECNQRTNPVDTRFRIGTATSAPTTADDELEQLERLYALYEKGAISADEYRTRKAKLLGD